MYIEYVLAVLQASLATPKSRLHVTTNAGPANGPTSP